MKHNKRMNENELTILVSNEIEWRKMLWKKLEDVEKVQDDMKKAQVITDNRVIRLEVKNALIGTFFGAIGGSILTYFTKTH